MIRSLALAALVGGVWWIYRTTRPVASAGTLDWINADAALDAIDSLLDGSYMPKLGPYEPPQRAMPYLAAIRKAEIANAIPGDLLVRLLDQESSFLPDVIDGTRRSSVGAIGIAQVMPATAASPGLGVDPLKDPTNPWTSITFAAAYLAALRRRTTSWKEALAAYNFGLGNVLAGVAWPRETRNYVAKITRDVPVA